VDSGGKQEEDVGAEQGGEKVGGRMRLAKMVGHRRGSAPCRFVCVVPGELQRIAVEVGGAVLDARRC
jgi:hypothetical protein